jgi:hypothetical protein
MISSLLYRSSSLIFDFFLSYIQITSNEWIRLDHLLFPLQERVFFQNEDFAMAQNRILKNIIRTFSSKIEGR